MIPAPGACNTLGCQPSQVNQQEYLASAEQYSYANVNFQSTQPPFMPAQDQSGFVGVGPQFSSNNQGQYPNQQNFNQGQSGGTQNFNQGQFPGGSQNSQYNQGNPSFTPQFDQNQGAIMGQETGPIQQLKYANVYNDSMGRPVVEQVNVTRVGEGTSNITINRTQYPNPNENRQGSGFPSGGSVFLPQADTGFNPQQNSNLPQGYSNSDQQNLNVPQQDQFMSQGYPPNQEVSTGGFFTGDSNSGMNNAGFPQQQQQQPQRLPGQLIGANGVTTGGVIMAPNGQGVPLLVSPDYLQNNRMVSVFFTYLVIMKRIKNMLLSKYF